MKTRPCKELIFYGRNLHDLTCEYQETTFPCQCWRRPMKAFDSSASALPESARLDYWVKLCEKRWLDPAQCRLQMASVCQISRSSFQDTKCNRLTWMRLVESCRVGKNRHFRADRNCVVVLGLTYLVMWDQTTSCERTLADLTATESLPRMSHLSVQALRDHVKVGHGKFQFSRYYAKCSYYPFVLFTFNLYLFVCCCH